MASNNAVSTAQQRFDDIYISSSEICSNLSVTRAALVSARKRGILPKGIEIPGGKIYLWERQEVNPALEEWKTKLNLRRGAPNA